MAQDMNRMVKAYIRMRDARAALKRQYEEEDGKIKAQQEKLEAIFLRELEANRIDSVKTENGTVYRSEDVIPQAEDWGKLYQFIRETDAFEALEKRITKRFVKEYMEANDGTLPPGVRVFRKYAVNIRRS